MKIGLITPQNHLQDLAILSDYHLILGQECLKSKTYSDFYRARSAAGDIVILDNCAYEEGTSMSDAQLIDVAVDINPTAVILPDVRFDSEATIERSFNFLEYVHGKYPWKLLAVPQGKDFPSVMDSFDAFADDMRIDGFGIYEEIGDVTGHGSRYAFLQYLEDNEMIDEDAFIHLLGMEEDPLKVKALSDFDWVMGVDSCKPIVYGIAEDMFIDGVGAHIPYPHRPKGYFDMTLTEKQLGVAKQNCFTMIRWCDRDV